MQKATHRLYLILLTLMVAAAGIYLTALGWDYYQTGLEERFFHQSHELLKPSGLWGHGLGVAGTLLILGGVFGYMARKRYRFMRHWGLLKHWLEFHIFLCTLGPLMILFHTSFKFGGIVSISFWSMVAVFLSGIAGRFIYLQIPRSIEGRELSLNEVRGMRTGLSNEMKAATGMDSTLIAQLTSLTESAGTTSSRNYLANYLADRKLISQALNLMKQKGLAPPVKKKIKKLIASELSLNHRIARLQKMQQLFRYWHVAHLPFALVMLVIMVIHVVVTILFGFRWIF